MSTVEVCAVCELPHPCPSGHNCGPIIREVPDEAPGKKAEKAMGKHSKNEPEVRGGESRQDWDPAVTEVPDEAPVTYDRDDGQEQLPFDDE